MWLRFFVQLLRVAFFFLLRMFPKTHLQLKMQRFKKKVVLLVIFFLRVLHAINCLNYALQNYVLSRGMVCGSRKRSFRFEHWRSLSTRAILLSIFFHLEFNFVCVCVCMKMLDASTACTVLWLVDITTKSTPWSRALTSGYTLLWPSSRPTKAKRTTRRCESVALWSLTQRPFANWVEWLRCGFRLWSTVLVPSKVKPWGSLLECWPPSTGFQKRLSIKVTLAWVTWFSLG